MYKFFLPTSACLLFFGVNFASNATAETITQSQKDFQSDLDSIIENTSSPYANEKKSNLYNPLEEEINNALERTKQKIEQISCLHKIYESNIQSFEYFNYNLIAGLIDVTFLSELDKIEQLQLKNIDQNQIYHYFALKNKLSFLENISFALSQGYPEYIADIAIQHLQTEVQLNRLLNISDQELLNTIFLALTNIDGPENFISKARQKLHDMFLDQISRDNIIFNKKLNDMVIFANQYGHEKLHKHTMNFIQLQVSPVFDLITPVLSKLTDSWLPKWQDKYMLQIHEMIKDAIDGINNELPNKKWTDSPLNLLVPQETLQNLQESWDLLEQKNDNSIANIKKQQKQK